MANSRKLLRFKRQGEHRGDMKISRWRGNYAELDKKRCVYKNKIVTTTKSLILYSCKL